MVLLFKNEERGTFFFVDSTNSTANFVAPKEVRVLFKYKEYLSLEILTLPDYKTVVQFKKIIAKGALKNVAKSELKSTLCSKYPEYFI